MSDANADEELERIRARKKQELAEKAGKAGVTGGDGESSGTETPTEPIHVESDAHFQEVVASERVVLVDFYADWCGPCQMLEPTVASVAAETEAAVVKVDIDAHQGLAQQYSVRGVPTLYLFVDGEPTERLVGVQDESTLVNLIQAA